MKTRSWFSRNVLAAAAIASVVFALVAGALVALERSGSAEVHAQSVDGDPFWILTFDEQGVEETTEQASQVVGFPVEAVDASSLGLKVSMVRIEPAPAGLPADAKINPARATVQYFESGHNPRNEAYSGLRMDVKYLAGRVKTSPASRQDDTGKLEPLQTAELWDSGIAGYDLTLVRDAKNPEMYGVYLLAGEDRSFEVLVNYEPNDGRSAPAVNEILPILSQLAQTEGP